MPNKNESPTNTTTRLILNRLFGFGVFAWRHNTLPVPIFRAGIPTGFRSGSKQGLPDIMGIVPPGVLAPLRDRYGIPLWVEVKTGRDSLRPEQLGAHATARKMGAIVLVVKDEQDFLKQWNDLFI